MSRKINISLKIVRKLCKPDLVEEIEGNLLERHDQLSENSNFPILRYWLEVLNYLRPSMLRSFQPSNSYIMFIFNPRLALRNLLKHRTTTFISLAGFIVGLLSSILLYFYIENELNYDAFHQDKDRIYRVKRLSSITGEGYDIGVTSGPYAQALLNDYPSTIQEVLRVNPDEALVEAGDKRFYEENLISADSNFFEFFSYPLAIGDPHTALDNLYSAVLTKEMARKYFGDQDPMGKTLKLDNDQTFTVTGILDDLPNKTQLEFDLVFNLALYNRYDWFHGWWSNGLITYAKINSPEEAEHLNTQLPLFMEKYFGEDFKKIGSNMSLAVEPLSETYFNNKVRYDHLKHGNKNNILILGLVALAILFIASFNYVNLSIAQSHKRAKEVGIRKVLGVNRSRLILQFLGEAVILLSVAIILSISLAELIRPAFNQFFGLNVIFTWTNPLILYSLATLFVLVLLTSGLYPALLLSSFQPLKVLKGRFISHGKSVFVRKGLVIAQFAISIFLIIATFLISEQVRFMKNKSLGYNQESILVIENNNTEIRTKKEAFTTALRNHPNVLHAGTASGAPGGYHDGTVVQVAGVDQNLKVRTVFADTAYLKIFDIPVVAGRGFNPNLSTEMDQSMMINEKALEDLGVQPEDIIGKKTKIPGWNIERTIIGVFRDYHFLDLKNQIEPQAIMMGEFHRRYLVKLRNNNLWQTLDDFEKVYAEFAPNYPMTYRFLDDTLARQYINEEKQVRVFVMFSIVSIFLACLGIFGLATYSAQQRQKELGIRKVLGASISQIIGLISKEFMILVALASVVAIPLSWYFMGQWLMDFAYRIDLSANWFVFIAGGISSLLIALITISLKTYKTAASNPSGSIRYE